MKTVFRVCFVLSLALVMGCGDDDPTASIRGMSPNQVSIGQQNAIGTINGTSLRPTAVSLGDGIEVTGFTAKSSSEVEVRFNVSGGAAAGPRNITMTTTGGALTGNSALNVLSNKVPLAKFSISPTAGSLATVFEFDGGDSVDQLQSAALSYNWKFGDGATATGRKVNHKYTALGNFNVELQVADDQGGSASASKAVEVLKNSPPIVDFTVRPGLKGNTITPFKFDASKTRDPDGRVADYIWDFGDKKKKGVEVEHIFEKKGTYTVELRAIDNKGNDATLTKELEVEKATQVNCLGRGGNHPQILRGTVIAVEPGNWAIVDFGPGRTCGNTFHKCDDFRKFGVEGLREFFGIVDRMFDRGHGVFAVHNACPLFWPPAIGEKVFLYYKTCSQNHCPG